MSHLTFGQQLLGLKLKVNPWLWTLDQWNILELDRLTNGRRALSYFCQNKQLG